MDRSAVKERITFLAPGLFAAKWTEDPPCLSPLQGRGQPYRSGQPEGNGRGEKGRSSLVNMEAAGRGLCI